MDQHHPDIARLLDALRLPLPPTSDFDHDPGARPHGPTFRPASVLVPLVERTAGPHVILTRRAARLRHHPGQIAFPGGKQDPSDSSALAAALREAREEIGLHPDQVRVLGQIAPHETLTQFRVTPFIGLVDPAFVPTIDPEEVEEVFEVPLRFVLDPANRQIHWRRWKGGTRSYPALPYGPHYIWGATARMLAALGDRVWAS